MLPLFYIPDVIPKMRVASYHTIIKNAPVTRGKAVNTDGDPPPRLQELAAGRVVFCRLVKFPMFDVRASVAMETKIIVFFIMPLIIQLYCLIA